MNDPGLHELAAAAGVSSQWRDWRGQMRTVSDVALGRMLHALELPSATGGGNWRAFLIRNTARS